MPLLHHFYLPSYLEAPSHAYAALVTATHLYCHLQLVHFYALKPSVLVYIAYCKDLSCFRLGLLCESRIINFPSELLLFSSPSVPSHIVLLYIQVIVVLLLALYI
jgi:hypothetical protein